ncbi:hypothetical protein [Xenorhabdus bovienii]|uniref:hypothetical protein n=1 Tax=Xenorhabdus bovienii TaxID=40576 RepID=UPI0023B217E3|nr:hypothetical protein [Xenorhabdus bovienii]
MGTKLAGTLDSQSTYPCGANLIHSIPDSYQNTVLSPGKTETQELLSETKKWIGFSVSPEIDYCGIKCIGRLMMAQFLMVNLTKKIKSYLHQ